MYSLTHAPTTSRFSPHSAPPPLHALATTSCASCGDLVTLTRWTAEPDPHFCETCLSHGHLDDLFELWDDLGGGD